MEGVGLKPDHPDILSLLKALQPNTLYLITSKKTFLSGFNAYRDERLQTFSWTEKNRLLKGILSGPAGDAEDTVIFSARGIKLHYKCTCRNWTPDQHCKHVICSLLTIINLISPELFHQTRQDALRRQALKGLLYGDKERVAPDRPLKRSSSQKHDKIEVVIESIGEYPSVFIRKGGTVVDSPVGLPPELSGFTYRYFTDHSLRDRLFSYLSEFKNRHPLVLISNTGTIPIEWDPSLSYRSKTELKVTGQHVEIRALSLLDKVVCEKVVRFWDFVANPETGKLGQVNETAGWNLYNDLDHFYRRSTSSFDHFEDSGGRQLNDREWIVQNIHFRVPLTTFQSIQFNIAKPKLEETLDYLVLKVNKKQVSPTESRHQHRLTIDPGEGENATLRTECWLGSSEGLTTAHTFSFFTDIFTRGLPASLTALKRLLVLYQTFFRLFQIEKEAEGSKVIRLALSNGDFMQYAVKQAARDLLKHYFSALKDKDVRLHFSENNWFIVPNEKEKEALLYKIPFELFGPKIFKEMRSYHEISVPKKQLYAQISLLHAQCKGAGIALYHKKKPVKTAKWDFSFDARRRSGIDWFEIRPEIRSNGVVVDEAAWQKLLQRKGFVEKEGTVQIVDSNAQRIIDALSLIYNSSKAEDRSQREIVQVPRMQILDWVALRKEGVEIKLPEEDEALINHLTQLDKIERIRVPRALKARLRPYQKEGLDWLAFLYQHRFGAILADDMGLGKTIQAISLLAALKEKIIPQLDDRSASPAQSRQDGLSSSTPHLIVVPPTLLFNWENELDRFYPDLKVYQYVGKERKAEFKGIDVVLTTYALVRRDIKKLKNIDFHVIIFDEAQAVKNVYAETTGAVRQLNGLFKLVMTGTPLENHLGEYYSLIDLSLPGLLGEYDQFKSQTKLDDSPMLEVLIRRTRPFVLRRLKESVLKELPPKVETDIYLELTADQKDLYQQTVALISSKIDHAYRKKSSAQAKIIALTAIMKLRQLCVSPRLIMPDREKDLLHSPKMAFLINQLQELYEEGHSALVFSQFTRGLDLLEEDLKPTGLPYFRLDGKTPTKKRKILVKGFQEEEGPSVFLLSLKAGGQGLNLTKASYVFHLDPWWNPAVENQASDRAHRIGQKEKVSITRILMRHSIEEKMMVLKKKKLALYDAVMGGAEKGERAYSISKSDFDFLLGE